LVMPNSTITITLKKDVASKKYKSVLAKLAKKISIDGFRKGTVPPKIAEEQLGQAKVIEYVLEELIPEAYQKTIKDNKKSPITRPEFSITSAKLGEDWTIESYFAELPEVSVKKYETHVKNGAKEGDKAVAKAKKEAAVKKKDEKTKAPEMTPDQEKEIRLQHIFKELVTKLKPKVPEILLKQETQHEFEHISGQLKQLNMSVEDYLKRRGMSMEDLSQDLAVSTLGKLQLEILLGAISREKKLKVEDKDREAYFATIKDEKVKEQIKKDKHHLGHLETNLLKQKVVDHLLTFA
jgi:FKBP-type peptidyl-prolyl cis-trans isomerase (trigger factor)